MKTLFKALIVGTAPALAISVLHAGDAAADRNAPQAPAALDAPASQPATQPTTQPKPPEPPMMIDGMRR